MDVPVKVLVGESVFEAVSARGVDVEEEVKVDVAVLVEIDVSV